MASPKLFSTSGRCNVDGCQAAPERDRKGMCRAHYQMMYRRGSTVRMLARAGEPEAWLRAHVTHADDGCLTWPFARTRDGAGRLGRKVDIGNGILSAQAARVMCALKNGPPPTATAQAAHSCGRGHHGCINPCHLGWKTPRENTLDKQRHGTQLKGEAHPVAKLTELHVRAIRKLADDFSLPELADIFSVHPWTICDVIDRKTWAWLK